MPLDPDFTLVPFSPSPCGSNDDGSTFYALDGWSFDLRGEAWDGLFINNNGNVSFGASYNTYSADAGAAFVLSRMLAPFWSDVDTTGTGAVWLKEWSVANGDAVNRLVITWDHVGYYDAHSDLLNTFQVILTDGTDPLLGFAENVCFSYGDMQWTTGDASNGVGGFGAGDEGSALVGASGFPNGYITFGMFNRPGTDFDGPDGSPDGVDYLDGRDICFSMLGTIVHEDPVFVSGNSSYEVVAGSPFSFTVEAIGPESNQIVTVTNDASGAPFVGSVDTPGTTGSSELSILALSQDAGRYIVTFTATDDGAPATFPIPNQSTLEVEIVVVPAGVIGTQICDPAQPNSTGFPAKMWATGSDDIASNDVSLVLGGAPPSGFCLAVASQETNFVPNPSGSEGDLCIASFRMGRYNAQTSVTSPTSGYAVVDLDLAAIPIEPGGMTAALAGETWNWQFWYRDVSAAGLATSNFSNAVSVTFR